MTIPLTPISIHPNGDVIVFDLHEITLWTYVVVDCAAEGCLMTRLNGPT